MPVRGCVVKGFGLDGIEELIPEFFFAVEECWVNLLILRFFYMCMFVGVLVISLEVL